MITGHEGFLGSNMTKTLLNKGAKVVGIDINVKRKNTLFTADDYRKMVTIKGSVADYNLLRIIFKKYKPAVIFHLAAEALVGKCNNDPLCTFSSNIEGTWKLLEAARHYGRAEAIVVASSDKAYGSHKELPYRENAPLIGNHPYDVSKSCADMIAYTYFHTYRLPVVITRCGNIYGPGDFNFSRIVPDAIRCAIKGKTLLIRSDGMFTRDYIFVSDIVNGYLMIVEQMKSKHLEGEAFNFSDENPITVIEFVRKIYKTAGKKPGYRILNQAKYEIKHQYLSSTKAKKILKRQPQHTLEQGLQKTIDWYNSYYNHKSV